MLGKIMRYCVKRVANYRVKVDSVKAEVNKILSNNTSQLNKIGFLNETDKASLLIDSHSDTNGIRIAHDYLRHYDFFFASFRDDKFNLLEFGCQRGNSLRMWEKYFTNAEIYGVDIDESTKVNEKDRVHIVIGNAVEKNTHDQIKSISDKFFIILDDASHAWGDQRLSFELFWDLVTPGGFYVIEDLECGTLGAFPEYPPKIQDAQPFYEYIFDRARYLRWAPDREPDKNSYQVEQLPANLQKIQREMDMCVFIPGAVIVRKRV